MNCLQCGFPTEHFCEGVCGECQKQNQAELDQHNLEFDEWETLTAEQREYRIQKELIG